MADLVERVWDGPFDAELPDMRTVRRGETALVTPGDAESAHWLEPGAAPDPPPPPPPSVWPPLTDSTVDAEPEHEDAS